MANWIPLEKLLAQNKEMYSSNIQYKVVDKDGHVSVRSDSIKLLFNKKYYGLCYYYEIHNTYIDENKNQWTIMKNNKNGFKMICQVLTKCSAFKFMIDDNDDHLAHEILNQYKEFEYMLNDNLTNSENYCKIQKVLTKLIGI